MSQHGLGDNLKIGDFFSFYFSFYGGPCFLVSFTLSLSFKPNSDSVVFNLCSKGDWGKLIFVQVSGAFKIVIEYHWKNGKNKCVHLGVEFPSLLIGAGVDKYPWLLQRHLTWKRMLILHFSTEDKSQMFVKDFLLTSFLKHCTMCWRGIISTVLNRMIQHCVAHCFCLYHNNWY